MGDIVLKDIDPVLAERIRNAGQARGWGGPETLQWLLEQGLAVFEQGQAASLDTSQSGALEAAIAALEQIPDDPGYALIGRASSAKSADDGPDQTVDTGFSFG